MAQLQLNFISECLMRTVPVNVIIPLDKIPLPGTPKRADKPFKTLYLLHGGYGNYTDWLTGTRIQRWAEERDLAVVMPSGDNKFYVDNLQNGDRYGEFIGRELVEFTRRMFPLSPLREDTYIAGLSMGGYGATVNGLKYSDTFGAIGSFSAGYILDDIIRDTELGQVAKFGPAFYQQTFGPKESLKGSDRDYEDLARRIVAAGKAFPALYIAVGTEDFLYKRVNEYCRFLESLGVNFTYEESAGGHEWDFWDRHLKRFLDWLPLEGGTAGLNSGNVR
ncbi:alpha/beta hydrolase [Luoshenia tenuis]|uniref:alpha/beta hydrolase n=1 Tax=Luoshenia tenuis TaxID=2763654 RepID=UPI003D91A7D5